MDFVEEFSRQVSSWERIASHPHRFGGREFRIGDAEIGHIHPGGVLDIPFPRRVRDALIDEHLAEEHHWVPNSGWITFHMRNENDLPHALWLMRLSYLRYQLKSAADPRTLFQAELKQLKLSHRFQQLFEPFLPTSGKRSTQPVPA